MFSNFIFRNKQNVKEETVAGKKRYFDQTSFIATGFTPKWSPRNYNGYAREGYMSNVIAYRAVNLISKALCNIDILVTGLDKKGQRQYLPKEHPIIQLLLKPNITMNYARFIEYAASHYLIAGNVFIQGARDQENKICEMQLLRPDRVTIIPDAYSSVPVCYRYTVNGLTFDYECDIKTGYSDVLHIKTFNPIDDWYGFAPMEAAQYSIDQHNECIKWNKALLENGARPSGALVTKGNLSDDAFNRLQTDLKEKFSGGYNAGNVMVLEGGLDWKEMSVSPRDMEFSQTKDAAARDIAAVFGVPSQLLGIKGDATYSNMAEARLALWEETIIPIGNNLLNSIAQWIDLTYDISLDIELNIDSISALAEQRKHTWSAINNADFLTTAEKREEMGFQGDMPPENSSTENTDSTKKEKEVATDPQVSGE